MNNKNLGGYNNKDLGSWVDSKQVLKWRRFSEL